MTLNHSKTWPVSTLAVVQLRVDPHGRTYSTLTGHPKDILEDGKFIEDETLMKNSNKVTLKTSETNTESENGIVYPLSTKHLELFTKMSGPAIRTTIRTDTVSTILDQDIEFDVDQPLEDPGKSVSIKPHENGGEIEKFHVLALTRIDENVNEGESQHHGVGRRPSIKVDNWDFIYTETKPTRCPIHSRCDNNSNGTTQAKDVPDLPLDARKTTTLRRHYYLEGGWGWVIVVCSVLVHVLNHGVQLSCSQLILPGSEKFKVDSVHFAGFSLLIYLALGMLAVSTIYEKEGSLIERVLYLLFHVFLTIASTLSYISYPKRLDYFLAAFKTTQGIDDRLSKLGYENLTFRFAYYLTYFFISMFWSMIPISVSYSTFFLKRNIYIQFGEHLSFGVNFVLMTEPIVYWMTIMVTLYTRMEVINKYLQKLNWESSKKCLRSSIYIKQKIILLSDLHHEICQAANNITYSLAPVILTFYVGSGLFMTASLLVLLNIGMNIYKIEMYFWTIIFIGSIYAQVILFEICRYEIQARRLLCRHYYPEGGWGWIVAACAVLVHIINHGFQLSCSQLVAPAAFKFHVPPVYPAGWLGAMSTGVALLISPVTIAFCRRKSTRVTAVMGGLITALGCLFTSFATQFHQLFFSYGTVVGIGVGITRDCSTLMVAQYFKRRREFVEIFIVSGSGLGIATMSVIIRSTIGALGWRLGLQVVTGAISVTFILGTFYRSASLYHPQRRAILHIKNQKRKIKDKNKIEDKIPFFDFSTLKSKTVRILLISTGISAFGINTPLFYLAYQAEVEGLGDSTVFLQMYLGLAWTVGCVVFSTLVLHNSTECRIARQYLCQTAVFMCGLSILAFTVVSGNYHAYVMFAWIYGIFCGGYHYSLKMYTYERVRARNFARTWGFVQCSQAIPIVIGVPFSGYMNERCGDRAGYYFSSTCVLVGSLTLFLIDLHRRKISRHKHTRENGTRHLCVSETCPQRRKLSFSQEPENDVGVTAGAAAAALVLGADLAPNQPPGLMDNIIVSNDKPELTCISEEGIADMDLPDNLLDDLDYIGDCITSCNKVENYLMLSEFENNLIAEMPVILDRKGRRWSLARSKLAQNEDHGTADDDNNGIGINSSKWKVFPNRVITVIDESSV